jgi:hypothetical protein
MKINQSKLDTLIEETEKTLTVYRSIKSVMKEHRNTAAHEVYKLDANDGICYYCLQNHLNILHKVTDRYTRENGILVIGKFDNYYIIAPLFDVTRTTYQEAIPPRIEFLETVLQECKKLKKATK